MELGKLEKVDLRYVWKHEAFDFTNWLAQPENLSLLSEEIQIDISLVQTEASVGKFSVDILAKEQQTERKIVIENQLENTDHDHLGKIITYASGYDAEIVIWIVRDVRDEHKRAIDWLNEHTDEKINFFVIKMELWQINGSPVAPKFHVVSQPNDWAKAVKQANSQASGLSDTRLLKLEFWEKFKEFAENKATRIRLTKPQPQMFYNISLGTSEAGISLNIYTQSNQISCEVYIPDSKKLFQDLESRKEVIEKELDQQLTWLGLPQKKASRIRVFGIGSLSDTDTWERCFDWMLRQAEIFQRVFSKHISEINKTRLV